MFPFVPIDQESVRYDAWGSPLHGLYEFFYGDPLADEFNFIPNDRSHVVTNVGAPPMQVLRSVEHWMSTPQARIVDTGSTFVRDPNLSDFDEAHANEWRDKAIVNGSRFYSRLNTGAAAWVYTDANGTRWAINAFFSFFKPNRIIGRVETTPFGQFKYPNAFWNIDDEPDDDFPAFAFEIDGAAGMVDSTGITTQPYLLDITNDGKKALIAVGRSHFPLYNFFVQGDFGNPNNFRKSAANIMEGAINPPELWAIYLFELSGIPNDPDDPFVVDFSVYKDQETATGTVENDLDQEVSFRVWSAYYSTLGGGGFTRPFLTAVPPGSGEADVGATLPHIGLSSIDAKDILPFCGWTREDCEGGNHVQDDPFNPTATKWIKHTGNPDQGFSIWEESQEYVLAPAFLNDALQYNGFFFTVAEAHTTDPLFQPGVGPSWQDKWDVQFDDPEMAIGDIPLWAEDTTYASFDAVHDGAANYYISKGAQISFDGGPPGGEDEENFNEPGTGSASENFWDGPFSVLLTDFWVEDKVISNGWVIKNAYTEPAFSGEADLDVNTATFRCIRSHNSTPENEPGHGATWRIYWEKANDAPAAFHPEWVPPIEYEIGNQVDNTGVGGDDLRYIAVIAHVATASNRPPGVNWVEALSQPVFCPFLLPNSIGGVAYHLGRGGSDAPSQPGQGRGLTGHKAADLDMDLHVKDIYVWAQFRDDDTIKEYTVDVQYEQTKRDLNIDFCWSAPGRTNPPAADPGQPLAMLSDDAAEYSGELRRGPSTVDEKLTYKFNVDGAERQEILITSAATASGEDIWTENFSTYPLTWEPSSNRSLIVFLEGVEYANINDNFSIADENDPPGSFQKQDWGPNGFNQDFCAGVTFQYIDHPYMERFQDRFRNAFNSTFTAFPGPKLTTLFGGTVTLAPISPFTDDQFDFRPQRTQEQKDIGNPVPSIFTVAYSNKLIGPLVMGRKNHETGVDAQYENALEPSDFPWQQFGLYAPEAEFTDKVTLTERSPTIGIVAWLKLADYGDDVSCAYDPFSKTIERNNQYKVVYL